MFLGSLFTGFFLEEGIASASEWTGVDEGELSEFEATVRKIFAAFPVDGKPNEANTENDLIFPILEALGWTDYSTQLTTSRKGRSDVPDMLLFANTEAKQLAGQKSNADAYKHGVAVVENKKWLRPLDRGDKTDAGGRESPPSSQIIRYLSVADVQSDGAVRWGILTNGRHWRLYYQLARSRSEDFLELDIPALLSLDGFDDDLFAPGPEERPHWLKIFYLLFRKQAFLPTADRHESFLVHAIDEGRNWEAKVAGNLSALVFNDLFPRLVTAIADRDPLRPPKPIPQTYCEEVRQSALILLYRLLFVLFAEDPRRRKLAPDWPDPGHTPAPTKPPFRPEAPQPICRPSNRQTSRPISAKLSAVFSPARTTANDAGFDLDGALQLRPGGQCDAGTGIMAINVFGHTRNPSFQCGANIYSTKSSMAKT